MIRFECDLGVFLLVLLLLPQSVRRKMQPMKNAAASAKETVANIGASAKAGMEKTKAVAQEKVRL